jgi:hypothetical protein
MLAQMSEEQKLSLSGKLVQDVLGAALDGIIPIDEESTRLLMKDALLVLCSKPMQLKAKAAKAGESVDDDEPDAQPGAEGQMEAVKSKLLSKVRIGGRRRKRGGGRGWALPHIPSSLSQPHAIVRWIRLSPLLSDALFCCSFVVFRPPYFRRCSARTSPRM